jgi:predicted negative regulator of RcsB-dependent stress response
LDIHQTEDEQVEALKAWLAENGRSAIFGVVLGLGAIFGWRAWKAHEVAQAEAASTLYQQLLVASQQPGGDEIRKQAEALVQQYPDSTYAVFGNMLLAKAAVDAGDLEKAATLLGAALKENQDDVVGLELRLRLAQVQNAQDRHADALATLNISSGKDYLAAFDELRGDIEVRRGNVEQARAAYERALSAAREAGTDVTVLELKLENLGRTQKS